MNKFYTIALLLANVSANQIFGDDVKTQLFPWKWANMLNKEHTNDKLEASFMSYIETYGKSYATKEEHEFRKKLYILTEKFILEWNANEQNMHKVAHNKFSDWTPQEREQLTGFLGVNASNAIGNAHEVSLDVADLPASINWVEKGAVQPVQNQGQCGSCWSFSAIGAMEGAHFVKTGQAVKLSEQQCVDCVTKDQGCRGGWQADCFSYAEGASMLTEQQYPYVALRDSCFPLYDGKVRVSTYTNVPKNSKDQLKAAIAKQPVAVTVDAGGPAFQQYASGIINDASCFTSLDHAVLAVGYGVDNGQEYFLVKNSWGAAWGEKGYVRIAAVDGEGICGIQQLALYPETN